MYKERKRPAENSAGYGMRGIILIVWGMLVSLAGIAQEAAPETVPDDADKSLMEAIARYTPQIREDLLKASLYPEKIKALSNIHDRTRAAFQEVITRRNRQKQRWFYEVSRYPELIHRLATAGSGKKRTEIDAMVGKPYPALQKAAWKLYRRHRKELAAIDKLYAEAEEEFNRIVAGLDREEQERFKRLKNRPEALSLLSDHLVLTTRLGNSYRHDPEGIGSYISEISARQKAENEVELEAYKNGMDSDPDAMDDLVNASRQYASENGYNYEPYSADEVINYYNYNPYSYWFGYPYWYGAAMWYPGAIWHGMGFYYGVGGGPVLVGIPSRRFYNWFYEGPYRYYPGLYYRSGGEKSGIHPPSRSGFAGRSSDAYRTQERLPVRSPGRSGLTGARTPSGQRFVRPEGRPAPSFNRGFERGTISSGRSGVLPGGGFSRGGGAPVRSGRR